MCRGCQGSCISLLECFLSPGTRTGPFHWLTQDGPSTAMVLKRFDVFNCYFITHISPFIQNFSFHLFFGRFTEVNQYNWFGYNVAPRIPNGSGFYLPLPTGSRRYGLHPVGVNTGLYPWEIQNSRNTVILCTSHQFTDCKHRKPS